MTNTKAIVLPKARTPLLPDDQTWLDRQNFSHAPTIRKSDAVAWFNERLGIPFKSNAVARAYDSGEILTALISGAALASEWDLARFALVRRYRHLSERHSNV